MSYARPIKTLKREIGTHGFVELAAVGGDDLTIVNAARQSFDQKSEEMGESEVGLIRYLLSNKHGSPFEQVEFWFNVRAPIFVIREWVRHRMAEINEESGRYNKLRREFWLPEPENVRTQVGKPGSYTYEQMDDPQTVIDMLSDQNEQAFDCYEQLLDLGVAKEVARTCLPVSTYSSFVWKANLRSLLNFVFLRNASTAQAEIRQYASIMEDWMHDIVPVTMRAFDDFGRQVP